MMSKIFVIKMFKLITVLTKLITKMFSITTAQREYVLKKNSNELNEKIIINFMSQMILH